MNTRAQPEIGDWHASLVRAQRGPIDESCIDGWRLCRMDAGAAELLASDAAATSSDITERLRNRICKPISVLARWIVDRQVVVLPYGADMVLPLFQFDFARGCVRSVVAQVIAELSGAMTDNDIAQWFVQPNGWLKDAAPAATWAFDVPAVLAAARADRWVVNG